jgi:hypothetical protein
MQSVPTSFHEVANVLGLVPSDHLKRLLDNKRQNKIMLLLQTSFAIGESEQFTRTRVFSRCIVSIPFSNAVGEKHNFSLPQSFL